MAYTMKNNIYLIALVLLCVSLMIVKFGKAEEKGLPHIGGGIEDPTQIVDKALLCFNDKYIYNTCNEAYRLDVAGDLHVPTDHTDEFCNGPCLTETNLVLHCIENIFENFEFYNTATIEDVRDTVEAGCGHDTDRGNFNVAEHLQARENKSEKVNIPFLVLFACVVLAHMQLMQ